MVFGCGFDPVVAEILLEKGEYAKGVVFVDVVGFELVKDNQHEQLQKDLLPEENEGQPEEEVEG